MAKTVTKDALYPGRIRKPGREDLTLTAADIDGAVTAANQLIADKYTIPLYWEHQNDNGPVKLSAADKGAHVAKHTFGRVAEAFKDAEGALQLKLEIDSDDDFNRLPKVRFVSPELRKDWTDADGRTWKGWTISHVAATPVPVQRQQKPFEPTDPIRLSLADYVALSDYGEGSHKDGLDAPRPSGDSGKGAAMTQCLMLLAKKKKVKLPADTTPETLCERLNIVLDALPDDEENTMNLEDEDVGEARESQPLALSLQKQTERAVKLARRDLGDRIQRLVNTGRVTPDIGTKLTAKLGSDKLKLSFNDDGELDRNELVITVEAYEKLPKNSAWKPKGDRVRLSDAVTGEPEEGFAEPASDDKVLERIDAMLQ